MTPVMAPMRRNGSIPLGLSKAVPVSNFKFAGIKGQRDALKPLRTVFRSARLGFPFHNEIGAKEAIKNPAGMEISPFFS